VRSRLSLFLALVLLPTAASSAELSDPTRPGYVTGSAQDVGAPAAALTLSAVFISGDTRIAVVNGRRVRIGETVGGALVRGIERDRVSFTRGDRTFSVSLLAGQARR